jgi:hypothetical protein
MYKCMYIQYIQGPLSVQAQYNKSCPIINCSCYNGSLLTWTVVCLTAAKFKPLIFPIIDLLCPFITHWHGPRRKHSLHTVEKACLLIRCQAMDVLLLRVRFRRNTFTDSLRTNGSIRHNKKRYELKQDKLIKINFAWGLLWWERIYHAAS